MPETCEPSCGSECAWIFDRLRVWPKIAGGTRVEWTLHPHFSDPRPHTFQLQFGRTGNPDADDWTNVGAEVTDDYFADDDTQRVYGKSQWTHYRVVLTTPNGTYASAPQNLLGRLSQRDWLLAREIIRRETLRLQKSAGIEGYLLKRRLFGQSCTCVDTQTGEVRNAQCPDCYGTGFVNGYYSPSPCFYAELQPHGSRNHLDEGQSRGTVDDEARTPARMLNSPQVHSYDVWVDATTDFRWIIHGIKSIVEIRGMPIVVMAELRLAPFSHPVYRIAI